MHEAEQYLRNPETPNNLYVRYRGRRRHLFYNREEHIIGIIDVGKRIWGSVFSDWNGIEKIILPAEKDPAEINLRLIRKCQREAAKAGFTNPSIRKLLNADYSKSLYENGITRGSCIDGQIITLDAVRKWCGAEIHYYFCEAIRKHKRFQSERFKFRGYEGSLCVEVFDKDDGYHRSGDLCAYFDKEYKGMANGYYYMLINEQTFIGYEID